MDDLRDLHSTHRELELLDALRSLGGSARTSVLAGALQVSEETVRRTVKALAKADKVQRVHGGVFLVNADAYAPVQSRLERNAPAKMRIAAAAARLIPDNSSVFLDVGSTTAYVAERLRDHQGLTVITNGLYAMQPLIGRNRNQVFLAGGAVRAVEGGTFGPDVLAFVGRFAIDTAVLSVDAVDAKSGFLLAGAEEADLARAVAARARRVIVVADASKFGATAPMVAFPPEAADVLVTDTRPGPTFQRLIRDSGIACVTAGDEAQSGM